LALRCENGHVACGKPVRLTFPEDEEDEKESAKT
jgi:hypothetical protein